MIRFVSVLSILSISGLAMSGCASPPVGTSPPTASALEVQLKAAQDELSLTKLRLADEMERADVQNYLRQQEVATAKRETASMKSKCGAPCTTP